MVFNTLDYVFFFIVVVLLYFWLPQRYRWIMLLAASYYFYMCWKAEYIVLIIVSTLIDYLAGLYMGRTEDPRKRKLLLWMSMSSNLGLLFFFKYLNFFNDNVRELLNQFNIFYGFEGFQLLLPVGISFYTFQSMSYTIDVYKREKTAESHFGMFALYIAYFPQLVAGPIERSTHLFPQFFVEHVFKGDRAISGLRLVLWGMFKKIVIADRLALYVESVYGNVGMHSSLTYIIAAWFFAIQLYCDFSGYSDIAIGSARFMGHDLRINFNKPYFSRSISEYWRRHHISLMSWFRDYMFIPLGGSRVSKARHYFNIMFVFLVSGLWHGAAWTFVFWGGLNGLFLVWESVTKNLRKKIEEIFGFERRWPMTKRLYRTFLTFNLVCLGFIFFRAQTLTDAFTILNIIVHPTGAELFTGSLSDFVYSWIGVLFLLGMEIYQKDGLFEERIAALPTILRWGFYVLCCMLILCIGVFDGGQFIYFQF